MRLEKSTGRICVFGSPWGEFERATERIPGIPCWQGPVSVRTTTARANGTALSAWRVKSTAPLCPRSQNWFGSPPRGFGLVGQMVGSRVPLYSWPMRTDGLRSELRLVDGFFALELNRRPFLAVMVVP